MCGGREHGRGLIDHLRFDLVDLVGYSMGGFVAVTAPGFVGGIIEFLDEVGATA